MLRPAEKPGEDWNTESNGSLSVTCFVAPGREAGRGLERRRIQGDAAGPRVAPGREAGRGLEQSVGQIGDPLRPLRPAEKPGEDWNSASSSRLWVM